MSLFKLMFAAVLVLSIGSSLYAVDYEQRLSQQDKKRRAKNVVREEQVRDEATTARAALSAEEIAAKIEFKRKTLIKELPKAQTALTEIEAVLRTEIDSCKATNLKEASELATFVSSVQVLKSSIESTLVSLNGDDINYVSLAIIGSGSIKASLDKLVLLLKGKGIDCKELKGNSRRIGGVTDDIYNYVLPCENGD